MLSEKTRWWIAGTTLVTSVFLLLWTEWQQGSTEDAMLAPSVEQIGDPASGR